MQIRGAESWSTTRRACIASRLDPSQEAGRFTGQSRHPMTPGLELAIVAMVCFGASDLIYKRAAALGVPAHHFVMVQAWFFFPCVIAYAVAAGRFHLNAAAWWGAAAGLFAFVAFYNFARSLRSGSVSRNAPIFRLNFTLTAALAIVVLGESLTAYKIAGLGLALAAVWLLLGERSGDAPSAPAANRTSLIQVVIATIALGIANFIYKVGILGGATPETLLVTQTAAFMPLATIVVFVADRRLRPQPKAWIYAPLTAALLTAGFIALLYGLGRGPASVLVPVAQMGFVVTALLGAVLFREKLNPRKLCGLVVALAALALLAIS
jgi:drug/metabolite transporter (DMT)-like permease